MEITYERIKKLVAKRRLNLSLKVTGKGELSIMPDGTFDPSPFVNGANIFAIGGKEYSGEEFENLLDQELPPRKKNSK